MRFARANRLVLTFVRSLFFQTVMILPAGHNKASGLAAGWKKMGLSHNVAGIGDAEKAASERSDQCGFENVLRMTLLPSKPNKSSLIKNSPPAKPENDQSSDHPALYLAGSVNA
jgi:hypothetical protein